MYVGLQLPSFWKNKGRPNLFYHVLDTNVYQCGLKGGDPTERICFTHHVLHPEQQAVYKFLLLELLNWNVWMELYPQVCSFSQAPLPLLRWIYFHIMFQGLPPSVHVYCKPWKTWERGQPWLKFEVVTSISCWRTWCHTSRAYWFGCQAVGGGTGWVGSEPQLVSIIQTTGVDYPSGIKKVHMHK